MFPYRPPVIRLIMVTSLVAALLLVPALQNIIPVSASADDTSSISVAMKHTKKITLLAVKNNGDEQIYGFKIKFMEGNIRFVKAKEWDREKIDASAVMIKTHDKPITKGKTLIILLIVDNKSAELEWSAINRDGIQFASSDVNSELKPSVTKSDTEFNGVKYNITGTANCIFDKYISCDQSKGMKSLPPITTSQFRVTWEVKPSIDKPVFFNWAVWTWDPDLSSGLYYGCGACYGEDGNGLSGSQIVTVNADKQYKSLLAILVNTNIENWNIYVEELPPIGTADNPINSHLNIGIGITDKYWIAFLRGQVFDAGGLVTDTNGKYVSGAKIDAIITSPSGTTVETLSGITEEAKRTSFGWKIPNDAELGIYTITMTATKAGSGSGTYSKSFEVISKEYCESLHLGPC